MSALSPLLNCHSCDATTSLCAGGAFDISESTSAKVVEKDAFAIQYFTAGSGVSGDYSALPYTRSVEKGRMLISLKVTDNFSIGSQKIQKLTMGLATYAKSVTTGIMGIGFASNEAIVGQEIENGQEGKTYPNLIERLKSDGTIETRSYSLYLDDLEADTGSIIFGGYDKSKFQGDLGILDIQKDATSGTFSTFSVVLSSIGVTDQSGSTVLTSDSMPNVVVLDSGTAFTVVPDDIYKMLVNYFGATEDDEIGLLIECDLAGAAGTLDFQFGSTTGPVVSVPFDELAVPLVDIDSGEPYVDDNNKPICRLGLMQRTDPAEPLLFGDTFLRSAYVVYDIDNLQIGVAQTVFNSTDSNIEAITATKGKNLPGSIVSGVSSIEQTATAGLEGGAETQGASTLTSSATAVGTGGAGAGALTGVKTTYTNRATNIPGSTRSAAAAASVRPLVSVEWTSLFVQSLVMVGGVLGGVWMIVGV